MGKLIIVNGKERYQDDYAIQDVVYYVLNKAFQDGFDGTYMLTQSYDSIVASMKRVQEVYPINKKSKIIHLIVDFDKDYNVDQRVEELQACILEYFRNKNIQCLVGYHYRTKDNENGRHFHVIINRQTITGELIYQNNSTYYSFVNWLYTKTGNRFQVLFNQENDLRD